MIFPLEVVGAETRRRGKTLVGPVTMTLRGAGITVIIGPNGSGKTTLLNLLHDELLGCDKVMSAATLR